MLYNHSDESVSPALSSNPRQSSTVNLTINDIVDMNFLNFQVPTDAGSYFREGWHTIITFRAKAPTVIFIKHILLHRQATYEIPTQQQSELEQITCEVLIPVSLIPIRSLIPDPSLILVFFLAHLSFSNLVLWHFGRELTRQSIKERVYFS
jgi:hypothetical protein